MKKNSLLFLSILLPIICFSQTKIHLSNVEEDKYDKETKYNKNKAILDDISNSLNFSGYLQESPVLIPGQVKKLTGGVDFSEVQEELGSNVNIYDPSLKQKLNNKTNDKTSSSIGIFLVLLLILFILIFFVDKYITFNKSNKKHGSPDVFISPIFKDLYIDYPKHKILIKNKYRYKVKFQGESHHFIIDIIYLATKIQITSTHGSYISSERMTTFLCKYNLEEVKEKLFEVLNKQSKFQ